MTSASYAERLSQAVRDKATPACVGIDPVFDRLPEELRTNVTSAKDAAAAVEHFSRVVIEQAAPHAPVVKINSAFFEAFYEHGVAAYYRLIANAHQHGLLVIGDIKRGDIGSTATRYASAHLATPSWSDRDPATIPDAVTLAGYLGENAVRPFVEAAAETGRGVYVLVRPSDPGADQIHAFGGEAQQLHQFLAALLRDWTQRYDATGPTGLSSVGAVVAAKDAASSAAVRASLPHTPLLVPGYGAQGAGAAECRPLFGATPGSAVINASRSVIYAYEQPERLAACNGDWRACIGAAAAAFANDVAPLLQP